MCISTFYWALNFVEMTGVGRVEPMMVVVVVFVKHLLDDTIWNDLNQIICMANFLRILEGKPLSEWQLTTFIRRAKKVTTFCGSRSSCHLYLPKSTKQGWSLPAWPQDLPMLKEVGNGGFSWSQFSGPYTKAYWGILITCFAIFIG